MIKQMKKIGNATLYCADCKDVLPLLKDIDACVTDPPYGLSFMGKQWDYDVPGVDIWTQVHDVLKPGAHLLSFFGSRTYHRGAIPIEDAGFEIRDQLMWIYGSGFPKSHNIGKAVDKLQGNEREVSGSGKSGGAFHYGSVGEGGFGNTFDGNGVASKEWETTKGNTEWEGWGTALKPAHEPIVMARKPFKGSVAENVLEHGTGGINIDECRVGTEKLDTSKNRRKKSSQKKTVFKSGFDNKPGGEIVEGRFPANVMHDGSEVVGDIFPKNKKSGVMGKGKQYKGFGKHGIYGQAKDDISHTFYGDEGSAARYFYCAKASKKDRGDDNAHPTVKPTELMRYLCRLVAPKGGVIVDPFMGSGSTGKAAIAEGFGFVGIEMNEDYFEIACARIEAAHKQKSQELF